MFAPFAPHFCEELWEVLGEKYSVFNQPYPTYDEKATVLDEIELAVQINSKLRGRIMVANGAPKEDIEKAAVAEVQNLLDGKQVKKIIIIPKRLVNLIV